MTHVVDELSPASVMCYYTSSDIYGQLSMWIRLETSREAIQTWIRVKGLAVNPIGKGKEAYLPRDISIGGGDHMWWAPPKLGVKEEFEGAIDGYAIRCLVDDQVVYMFISLR